MRNENGFTLIELLIVIAISTIVLSIAVPSYQRYVRDSQEGVLVTNMHTIELFQEDYMLRTGAYAVDLDDIAAINAEIGWEPQANDGITYSIADGDGTSYNVTGVHPDGITVCIEFPDKDRC
jgi:prepilin-type N-terminal cleavage/methylation domain-containing protein